MGEERDSVSQPRSWRVDIISLGSLREEETVGESFCFQTLRYSAGKPASGVDVAKYLSMRRAIDSHSKTKSLGSEFLNGTKGKYLRHGITSNRKI